MLPGGSKTVLTKIEFFKKCVFYHNEVTICVIEKVTNLDVQIWVFFGEMLFFTTVKHTFLLHFDRTK